MLYIANNFLKLFLLRTFELIISMNIFFNITILFPLLRFLKYCILLSSKIYYTTRSITYHFLKKFCIFTETYSHLFSSQVLSHFILEGKLIIMLQTIYDGLLLFMNLLEIILTSQNLFFRKI